MKQINFPPREIASLNKRLSCGKTIFTIRVSAEYGKYCVGDICRSNLSSCLRVVAEEKFTSLMQYKFYGELSTRQVAMLNEFEGGYHMLELECALCTDMS